MKKSCLILFSFTACLLVFSFTSALAKDISEVFPVGIYCVDDVEYIKDLKKCGFNIIQTYKNKKELIKELALECRKQKMFLLAYPDEIMRSDYTEEAKSREIIWYLFDEPDVFNYPPADLKEKNKAVKAVFPNQKTAFVISQGGTKNNYYSIADILMVDWYPVPHLPLKSLGDQIYIARKELDNSKLKDKPLWAVIQAFDWLDFPQQRENKVGGFPSNEQIRFMTYHAILNGADGIFYFYFKTKDKRLLIEDKENWNRLAKVVKEISALSDIFINGKIIANPVTAEYPVIMKTWEYKGKKYSIIANINIEEELLPVGLFDKKYKLKFEKSTSLKTINRGQKIKPFRVYVLEF